MFEGQEINAEHKNLIHDVAYNYYGDRMATCSSHQLKVWDKNEKGKWALTSSWEAHSDSVWKITWAHPEYGQVLATCSFDKTAKVWEETDISGPDASGTHHWVLRMSFIDSRAVTDVKFGPKSNELQLATCLAEGIIRIYGAPDVKNLCRWTLQHEIHCKQSLSCLDWSPSLSRLHPPLIAVGSNETGAGGKVIIYKYRKINRTWILSDTIESITGPVCDLAFAPNLERNCHILGVATNGIRIFNLTPFKDEQSVHDSLGKLDIQTAAQFDDHGIKRICWNVNGTVLASCRDDVCVRMFTSSSDLAELCLLSRDEDEAGYSAFYRAIHSGNVELLNTLINKWPGNYFAVHLDKLDEILSRAYEDLKLKNVPLSEQLKFFVENKLINLRFFSNSRAQKPNVKSIRDNVKERIDLILQSITFLETDYLSTRQVDEKFLFVTKFIAENIHILKRLLKSTYVRLPWEEMEFCLITFISSHTKKQEMNLFCRVALNKAKILKHLWNFARKLEDEKNILDGVNIDKLGDLPNLKRAQIVAAIKISNPQFEELYNDYQQIRDIHSLEKINSCIKVALKVDPTERKGQLIIMRALQLTGEYLKNTLESPKLSNTTSEHLLLTLPKNTREIIIDLRNSLSHAYSLDRRTEIEAITEVSFFTGVQTDIKTIHSAINKVFQNYKIRTIIVLLKKITDSEGLDEIKEVGEILRTFELEQTISGNIETAEHEKIQKLIEELSVNIIKKTKYENELFSKIISIINSIETRSEGIIIDYISGLAILKGISMAMNHNHVDHNNIRIIKFRANKTLKNMSFKIESNWLKEIAVLSVKIFDSAQSRISLGNINKMRRVINEIFSLTELKTGDLKYIEELKRKLNIKDPVISIYKERKIYNVTAEKYKNQFALKLSELKNILTSDLFSDKSDESFSVYMNNKKLQAAIEMLVLDLLSILDSLNKSLENNLLFLDDNTPLLTGKCLRNHLAHDNALVDILLSDPSIAVISNAKKLISEKLINTKKKVGKFVRDNPSNLKEKYIQSLINITCQEGMFAALEEGNLNDLKSYVKKGADIYARNINLWTTLHFAAKGPSLEVVRFILDHNLSPQVKDVNGQSPVHVAAAHGRKIILEFLIKEAGLNVNDPDNSDKTPLHVAAQNGNSDTVKVLLENQANTVTKDITGLSPLHYAIKNNHIEVAKILLSKDPNVDFNEIIGGFTPLHEAAENGHLNLVNFLLQNKADVNARNDQDWTPLHAASLNGHLEVLNALILKGANVNASVINGCTPLHYATETGHEKIVKILLQCGAIVNAIDKTYNNAPLHYAAEDGHIEIVKTLLKNKANVNVATVGGTSPLHLAARSGYMEIVAVLLNHGVNIHAKDKINSTPLHYAAESGHTEVARLLINSKADVNARTIDNLTPLHIAALNGNKDVADVLIKCTAEVNTRDFIGNTPLHKAAMNGDKNILDLLIKNKAEINTYTKDGTTPLHISAFKGHEDAIVFLIKNKADVNAQDNNGLAPLHLAIMGRHKNVVNLLIKNKAEINGGGIADRTPLHSAVEMGYKEIVQILIKNGANVNIKTNHQPPLISAVENDDSEIVELLVENGSDVNAEDGQPLLVAASAGNKAIVKFLLKNKAHVDIKGFNTIFQGVYITPLFVAAEAGHEEVVKILIENKANVNLVNVDETPLHIAAISGHDKVVKVLLNNGANINLKDRKNRTALELAVAHGRLQVVKKLLEYKKVDMDAKGNLGWTILHIAAQGTDKGSNLEMVRYLVNEGFDINAKNASGSKPLHIAAREGYKDIVEFFLSAGLSINDLGAANQTLLHYATINGHLEVIKFLITKGADVNAKDANGSTPAHIAAEYGSKDVIEILLKYGAVYNAVDNFYRNPLKIANDKHVINLLASTEKLFGAVKRNSPTEVENNIKAGAFVNASNIDIVTPLHYAAWKGYEEVVNVLLQSKANPSVVGKKGLTPLHYAAKFSHLKIVKALLCNGAIYNALSNVGSTPLDFAVDKSITNLLKLVGESFHMVENGNSQIVNNLRKIKDIHTVKAIMNARDTENKTLIVAAMHSNFSKVEDLKQISQSDVANQINTALMLFMHSDFESALNIFKSAFEKRKELLGPDNPGTLDVQVHIAKVLYKQGAYQEALDMLEEVCQKQRKILGLNDSNTLNTRSIIALVLHRQGKDKEASSIYQEVYQKQKEILGPNHSVTLDTQFHMALVLDKLGKYEEALNINKMVYEKRKQTLGVNNSATVSAQNNIALVLTSQGKYEEALKIYKEVLEKKKFILGNNHSDTLRTLHNIAAILCMQKNYTEALKSYHEVLNMQTDALGPNHPDTLNTKCNLADLLFAQGKFIGALKAYKTCFDQSKAVLGPTHPTVLNMLNKLKVINMRFEHDGSGTSEVLQYLQTEINIAASNGDIHNIQRLLKHGANVNDTDINGRTPLHYAISNGQVSVINILLKNGADVSQVTNKGNTTLHTATSNNNKEIIEVLLQHISRDKLNKFINAKTLSGGTTSLHLAAKNGFLDVVKSLLQHGAIYNIENRECKKPFDLSSDQSVIELLKLVDDLFENVKMGNVEMINKVNALKPDEVLAVTNARNNQGKTLLQVAIANKHNNIVSKLLQTLKSA